VSVPGKELRITAFFSARENWWERQGGRFSLTVVLHYFVYFMMSKNSKTMGGFFVKAFLDNNHEIQDNKKALVEDILSANFYSWELTKPVFYF